MDITKQVVEYLEDNTQLHIETIYSPLQQSSDGTAVLVTSKKTDVIDDKQDWWQLVESNLIPEFREYNYIRSAELITMSGKSKPYYAILWRGVSLDVPLNDLTTITEDVSEEESEEIQEHAQSILGAGI
jgi:hypothetical protein